MTNTLNFSAPLKIEAAAGEGKLSRFLMVANTGKPFRQPWSRDPVVMDLSGVLLDRQHIPSRMDHEPTLGVGHTERIAVEGGLLIATGVISRKTAAAEDVRESGRNGFPWQASVNAEVLHHQIVKAGESVQVNGRTLRGPLFVARKTRLKELSFVDLGADDDTSAHVTARSISTMDPATVDVSLNTLDGPDPVAAERERIKEIRTMCAGDDRLRDVEVRAIDEGLSVEATRGAVLKAIRDGRATPPGPNRGGGIRAAPTETIAAAALVMAGHGEIAAKHFGERVVASVPRLSGWPELAALSLKTEGRDVPRERQEMIRAAFSTVSMPQALGTGVEKVALQTFLDMSRNWMAISRIVNVATFREGKAIRLSSATAFEKVGKGGELKHGTIDEDAFSVQAGTYGKMFGLTREDIINDDLGLLNDIPVVLGSEGARTVSDLVFATIIANAGSFFSVGNGNQITTALGLAGLGEAVAKLRTRTDGDGRVIGLVPSVLLVPAALEATALGLVTSLAIGPGQDQAANLPTANPWRSIATAVVESRLDAASTTDWYLFGEARHGAVLAAFLNGKTSPTVESVPTEARFLGINWRAYLDFGISLGEHRSVIKSDVP